MPDELSALHARRDAHAAQLEAQTSYLTPRELAARWGCHPDSVRAIPRARLPYTVVGNGGRRAHRRYNPADVRAYELGRKVAA